MSCIPSLFKTISDDPFITNNQVGDLKGHNKRIFMLNLSLVDEDLFCVVRRPYLLTSIIFGLQIKQNYIVGCQEDEVSSKIISSSARQLD